MKKIIINFAMAFAANCALAQETPLSSVYHPATNNPGFIAFTSDAGTGISSTKLYTHAVSLGDDPASSPLPAPAVHAPVNGVQFTNSFAFPPGGNITAGGYTGYDGKNYRWSGFPSAGNYYHRSPGNIATPDHQAMYWLLRGHQTQNAQNTNLYISDLTHGAWYEFSWFFRHWESSRYQRVTFMPGDPQEKYIEFNPRPNINPGSDHALVFRYKAPANGQLHIWCDNRLNQTEAAQVFAFANEALNLVLVLPFTDITANSVMLHAEMSLTEIPSALEVWYGFEDGVWEGSEADPGPFAAVLEPRSIPVSGLTANTHYVYRFKVVNPHGVFWSDLGEFSTHVVPAITALAATDVGVVSTLADTGATANGCLDWSGAGFATADAWLHWARASEGPDPAQWMEYAPVFAGARETAEVFDHPISGLDYAVPYQYAFRASNDVATAWSNVMPFGPINYPLPVLDCVDFEFSPTLTNATVNVAVTGVAPALIFAWAETEPANPLDPASWPNTLTNDTAVAQGGNLFELPGVVKNNTYAYRVFLQSMGGADMLSGAFTAGHVFTWVGPASAGSRDWNTPANWNPAAVPNGAGDCVVFPSLANTFSVDFSGVGETLTLGGITATVASYATASLTTSNGTTLVWDNGAQPAFMNFTHNSGAARRLVIEAAEHIFTGETRVLNQETGVASTGTSFPIFRGNLTGPGFLRAESASLAAFGAAAGKTNRVDIALETLPADHFSQFCVFGPGTVLFEGRTNAFRFASNGGFNHQFLGGGGRLLLSNAAVTNTYNRSDRAIVRLFRDDNNTYEITNGGKLIHPANYEIFYRDETGGGGVGNKVIVNGPGSEFFSSGRFYLHSNSGWLSAGDGGLVKTGPIRFRSGYNVAHGNSNPSGGGNNNLVRVAGAKDGKPATLDLQNNNFCLDTHHCVLDLQTGGVVTNANVVQVGCHQLDDSRVHEELTADNTIQLAGGQLFCNTIILHPGNTLAPVINADAILPVVATANATFTEGSKIAPVHEDFNVQGRWMIVKSPAITLPVSDPDDPAFFVPPSRKAVYKLTQSFDPKDGMPALWLSCYKPGTIFMIR